MEKEMRELYTEAGRRRTHRPAVERARDQVRRIDPASGGGADDACAAGDGHALRLARGEAR